MHCNQFQSFEAVFSQSPTQHPSEEQSPQFESLPTETRESLSEKSQTESDVRIDGGWTAWSQVFVSFLLVVNGFGYFSSFGLFESHWVEVLNSSESKIAWVGSTSLFLLFMLGSLSGSLMDKGHFRSIVIVGCSFQIVGAMTTSLVTQYWQLILAQGVVQGIGNGLLFTPCVALVSVYFKTRRAFALSLAACGAPIGGIIFPLVRLNIKHLISFRSSVQC